MAKGTGKLFEEEVQTSAKEQKVWFFRVKDVNLPPDIRKRVKLSENPYDSLIFKNGYLFPIELKSTKGKSLPFKNIKQHQIDGLIESTTYDEQIIPGLLINFSDLNRSFFLHIKRFVEYLELGKDGNTTVDGIKVNEKSISYEYCEAYGLELKGIKKKVKMRWYVGELLSELINEYGINK